MSVTLSPAQRQHLIKLVARLVVKGVPVTITHDSEEGILVYRPNSVGGVNLIAIDEDGDCMLSIATQNLQKNHREFYSELTEDIVHQFCYATSRP